ncbi:MAG: anthranilate phosphoribosyltransferase [Syntrophaceticus sp.]|jgi:anthranilate phosphoribosyltransferase|nr:anthranilate phosphoribosyltransferase [Syntrophaceticus sp.]MDD3314973.1 anthranilate phosphoribosyltransferase [Syntrophaceticus sp.]MDD4359186.1 anthranilate phosphoribosyltransferase [Syntrophaceticus sp.]MDD4782061.1 anthranilate phosphoribosyltransferase [Syntrophaceticus sp.]
MKNAIQTVINGQNLNFDTAKEVMGAMMDGTATQAQMGALLTGLRIKGETVEEITACATVMREKGLRLNPVRNVIDIVGTGGDGTNTFNISTTSAFVIAVGGVPVAKHGNRGVSSKSGAADVLECLGINLNLTSEQSEAVLAESNICFMFSQLYHSSMKYAAPVRKEMGVRTIFNILGPLANPAGATMQLMGVYDRKLIESLAQVLANLGVSRGLVVSGGEEGMDEATLTGETCVCEIRYGQLTPYVITPEQFGFSRCTLEDLAGGSPAENAQITLDILSGHDKGPKRNVVVLNSAMALYLGIDDCTIADCIKTAQDNIDSGKALAKLEQFRRLTNGVAR